MRVRSKKKREKSNRTIVGANRWKGSNVQGRDPEYRRTNRVAVSNDALTRSYRIPTLRSITSRSHLVYVYSFVLLPVNVTQYTSSPLLAETPV